MTDAGLDQSKVPLWTMAVFKNLGIACLVDYCKVVQVDWTRDQPELVCL